LITKITEEKRNSVFR